MAKVTIDGLTVRDSNVRVFVIAAVESDITIRNMNIVNITSQLPISSMMYILTSILSSSNISFSDSSITLMESIASTTNVDVSL